MLENENLRVTRDSHEIRALFREYIRLKCPVLLWQNMESAGLSNAKRVIFRGHFSLINEDKDFIVLNYKQDPKDNVNFSQMSTLYIKGDIQSILFKVEVTHHSNGKVLFTIPSEVRILEKRARPRITFGYNFEGRVEFFNYKAYRSKRKHSSSKIIDLSQKGLAMLMYTGKAHSWSIGDSIYVTRLNGFEIPETILAEIRYIRTVRITRNNQSVNAYRMGVEFERDLTREELTEILKRKIRPESYEEQDEAS